MESCRMGPARPEPHGAQDATQGQRAAVPTYAPQACCVRRVEDDADRLVHVCPLRCKRHNNCAIRLRTGTSFVSVVVCLRVRMCAHALTLTHSHTHTSTTRELPCTETQYIHNTNTYSAETDTNDTLSPLQKLLAVVRSRPGCGDLHPLSPPFALILQHNSLQKHDLGKDDPESMVWKQPCVESFFAARF